MSYQKLRKNPLFWLVTCLLCLIPLLAVLQYSWIGELSRIELERRRRDLISNAFHFLRDFHFEILLMYTEFETGEADWQNPDNPVFTRQYAAWQEKAYFPALLQKIYWFDAEKRVCTVYETASGKFVPVPADRQPDMVRKAFTMTEAYQAAEQRYGVELHYFFAANQNPFLIIPVRAQAAAVPEVPPNRYVTRYLLIELDREYLVKEFFPDLVDSYFNFNNKQEYIVRIMSAGQLQAGGAAANSLLYESGSGFSGRQKPEPDFSFPLTLLVPNRPLQEEWLNQKANHRVPLIFRWTKPRGKKAEPGESAQAKTESAPGNPWEKWTLLMRAMEEKLELSPPMLESINALSHELSAFHLQVYHQSGSLELSVYYHQLRNVLISTGILILLGTSLILLLISYQKDKILSFKEKEFIATVTHELNTPLAVICSAGENLAKGIVTDKSRLTEYGELIKKEGFRLNKMVESILLYSGMHSRRISKQKEVIDVKELLEQVIARFDFQCANQGIVLRKELAGELPPLWAVKDLIHSVIDNVLSNAVKHGGQDTRIELKVQRVQNKGQQAVLEIQVTDNGPGIPRSELAHIFEPFFRGEAARSNQTQGSGLGLSLVKKILDTLKGRIKITSQPGKGTCCQIHIPFETR